MNIDNNEAAIVLPFHAASKFPPQDTESPGVDTRNFTTEDILWSIGIWTVILTASPMIVFYMLMVA